MYESSDSQFFRTTTGIQSGVDTFDESRMRIKILYFSPIIIKLFITKYKWIKNTKLHIIVGKEKDLSSRANE